MPNAEPISLEDRVHDIQIDLKHSKMRLDQIFAILYKIEKDGLKVKVKK